MNMPYPRPPTAPNEQFINVGGLKFCYEELGDPEGEPLLLIMGLACQMTAWPPEFIELFVEKGYRVIRFDNRDIGKSDAIDHTSGSLPPVDFVRSRVGLKVAAPYTLHDMAADVRGLLDALNITRTHVVGVSMGGMIAQLFAADNRERVHSLTLMMTSNNHPRLPMPDLNTLWRINGGGIRGHHQEAAIKRGLLFWDAVASPNFPVPQDRVIQRIARDYQRSYRPQGILRQMRSIMATGSLARHTKQIASPTLILHGAADPLVKVKAAHWLKENIPHAQLDIIPGWGHDLPLPLLPTLADKIIAHLATHSADQTSG